MVAVPPKWRCRAHLPDTALREGIFAHPILAQLRSNLFLKFNLERWCTASARV
jgi:hypothetical protein